ncbi:LysR family transcriptional regulator, partial [Pseudomonas parafulva]
MNWDDIRIFLAVHRAGTLRAAAKALGIDQTTVGRRLAGLEQTLSSRLFLRSTGGLALTTTGQQLVQKAEEMERMAVSFERQGEGSDPHPSGEVRVTTTDALAVDFVIPAIEQLRATHPEVRVILTNQYP